MDKVSPGLGRISRRDARRQRGRAESEMDERVGAQRLDDLHPAGEGMPFACRHEMLGADADDDIAAVLATGASDGVALKRYAAPAVEHHRPAADRAPARSSWPANR